MGIKVTDKIESNGPFATIDDSQIGGGFKIVADVTERDNIFSYYKKTGMMVYVVADGKYYRWDGTQWIETTHNANQLAGTKITIGAPSPGQILQYDATNGWSPAAIATTSTASNTTFGTIKLAGDIGGTAESPRVSKIQGTSIDTLNPTHGQIFTWSTGTTPPSWTAASPAIATTTSSGGITLAGDLAGTGTSAISPRVSGLQGNAVATGSLLSGDANKVLTWNGSKWAAAIIPQASTSAAGVIILTNDLSGASEAPEVIKIRGSAISTVAPTNSNQVLSWNAAPQSEWAPKTIGGDILGPIDNVTVRKIGKNSISTSTLSAGDGTKVLTWNGSTSTWEASVANTKKIWGIDIDSSAASITTNNTFLVYDASTLTWKPGTINYDMIGPAYTVSIASAVGNLQLYGTRVLNPVFTLGYSGGTSSTSSLSITGSPISSAVQQITPATSTTFTASYDQTPPPTAGASPRSTSQTFTLISTSSAGVVKSSSPYTITWTYRIYSGNSSTDFRTFTTDAQKLNFVTTLNYALNTSRAYTFTSNVESTTPGYIYFAYPVGYHAAGYTVKIGNDDVTTAFFSPVPITIPVNGVNVNYYVFQSDTIQGGNKTYTIG